MVLHAPSVWESFGKLRINSGRCGINKGQSEKSDWPFPFSGVPRSRNNNSQPSGVTPLRPVPVSRHGEGRCRDHGLKARICYLHPKDAGLLGPKNEFRRKSPVVNVLAIGDQPGELGVFRQVPGRTCKPVVQQQGLAYSRQASEVAAVRGDVTQPHAQRARQHGFAAGLHVERVQRPRKRFTNSPVFAGERRMDLDLARFNEMFVKLMKAQPHEPIERPGASSTVVPGPAVRNS